MAAALPNSVKQLSDSGAFSSLHLQFYASRDPAASSDVDATLESQIPTIDLSLLTGTSPHERARMVRRLGQACQDWGFFMVVNHGVPEGLRQAMLEAVEQFFDLEEEAKAEFRGETVLDPIRYGTSFNSKAEVDFRYWRDFLKLVVHPQFHSPAKPLCFSDVLRDYATRTRRVGMELLKGIWESLEVDENSMNEALKLDSCLQVFVANLYPPCPRPELVVGLPPHSDHGLLTLLHQNGVDGLDIEHGGKWVHIKPHPGSFLVNAGDHMQIVTNGRYKSALHRAMANGESTRVSVVTVVGPSLDSVVEPAAALVSSERPAMYRGWTYKQFLEWQQGNQLKGKSVLDLLLVEKDEIIAPKIFHGPLLRLKDQNPST